MVELIISSTVEIIQGENKPNVSSTVELKLSPTAILFELVLNLSKFENKQNVSSTVELK